MRFIKIALVSQLYTRRRSRLISSVCKHNSYCEIRKFICESRWHPVRILKNYSDIRKCWPMIVWWLNQFKLDLLKLNPYCFKFLKMFTLFFLFVYVCSFSSYKTSVMIVFLIVLIAKIFLYRSSSICISFCALKFRVPKHIQICNLFL